MAFLWLGLGGFAVLVVAIVVVGFLLPERYTTSRWAESPTP